ncbi:MAG: sulfatase-like hydrolase/transferase, partial [Desulfobacterales bacterium]|nr:sulfatase-like hydrolase/transferase [Desulfobacterales bacterium]
KGQIYEEGFHVPFIVHWPGVVQPGRVIDDFISFPDVAPTFMEAVGLTPHEQMTGKSFLDVLKSPESGQIDPTRNYVLLGKERHDTGRANEDGVDLAYPVRAIRNHEFLYVLNMKPERWPVGNPEYGWRNCDGSPTKSYLTALELGDEEYPYYELNFGKRPAEELYLVSEDADCMVNLADDPNYTDTKNKLRAKMEADLRAQGDPRILGQGDIFDQYPYAGKQFKYTEHETGSRSQAPKQ